MLIWSSAKRWMYEGDRPNRLAAAMNRVQAVLASAGLMGGWVVTLEVRGRKSGKLTSLPLVVARHGGQRYLVSMLGERASWVANVRAAGGQVTLVHGVREGAHLREVPVAERAPILKEYLRVAPGARPHVPVDKDAPLGDFERIARDHPVFHIEGGRH